jgi:DNA-binding MarR family transcriptional regulator
MSIAATRARREALTLLRLLVDSLHRSARSVERRTGITNAQLFLLQQLGDDGPLPVKSLASRARTDQSTASTVVRRLERAGLAAKRRSKADGRSILVSLTAAGRGLLRDAPSPPTAAMLRALERIPAADARALARGLRSLARSLTLAPREPAMLFEEPPSRRRGK